MVGDLNNDQILKIQEVFNSNAAECNQRIWDNVKFFTTLISSLIPVTLASSIAAIQYGQVGSVVPIKVLLVLIPIACLGASIIGWRNLRRECMRMYENMAVVISLRKLIGLDEPIKEENKKKLTAGEQYQII